MVSLLGDWDLQINQFKEEGEICENYSSKNAFKTAGVQQVAILLVLHCIVYTNGVMSFVLIFVNINIHKPQETFMRSFKLHSPATTSRSPRVPSTVHEVAVVSAQRGPSPQPDVSKPFPLQPIH